MIDAGCQTPEGVKEWILKEERVVNKMLVEALAPLAEKNRRHSLHSLLFNSPEPSNENIAIQNNIVSK